MHPTHTQESPAVIDLFAGAGGWEEGLTQLGVDDVLGIEWDDAACATARTVGHARLQADIAALDPHAYAGTIGLIGSPPCPTFSAAGNGSGRRLTELLVRCMLDLAAGTDTREDARNEACAVLRRADPDRAHDRARRDAEMSLLVVEPMRWAVALQPEWIALEQVPAVMPLWSVMARVLGAIGYSTWSGVLEAERYGVPQTRERTILLASRTRSVEPPRATHQRYVRGEPARLDITLEGEILPWVSMSEALGAGPFAPPGRGSKWRNGNQANVAVRNQDEPAPTIHFGHRLNDVAWVHGDRASTNTARVTIEQAAILQSFSPAYPWQGTRSQQYLQVGNAVPPQLARAVVAQLIDAPAAAVEPLHRPLATVSR